MPEKSFSQLQLELISKIGNLSPSLRSLSIQFKSSTVEGLLADINKIVYGNEDTSELKQADVNIGSSSFSTYNSGSYNIAIGSQALTASGLKYDFGFVTTPADQSWKKANITTEAENDFNSLHSGKLKKKKITLKPSITETEFKRRLDMVKAASGIQNTKKCILCGAHMKQKEGTYGTFFTCENWKINNCPSTTDINGKINMTVAGKLVEMADSGKLYEKVSIEETTDMEDIMIDKIDIT